MRTFDVDLFVIGAGSGGVRAARIAASHGASVAIAEHSRVGGTCVIRGCVPKKLFVYASRFGRHFGDASGFGWEARDVRFGWRTLLASKNTEISRLEGLYRQGLEKAGVRLIDGRAVIDETQTVRIVHTGERIRARHVLIATGGRPNHEIDAPGIEHAIDSDAVFELPALPDRVAIVGGGYIAVEFAGIMQGLGVKTTILHRGARLLRGFDEDIRVEVERAYTVRGIDIRLATEIRRISRDEGGLRVAVSTGDTLDVDAVMLATGRTPNTQGLGLEQAGVHLDANHAIKVTVDANTSVPWIHAVGDVTNRVNLTPVAIREGHFFADRLFGEQRSEVDYRNIPTAVFSTPEVAVVGLPENEAREQHPELKVYRTRFRPMRASVTASDEHMYFKLLVDGTTDKVIGAHAIGEDAAEMIQLIAVSLTAGATKRDFDRTVALHPTMAEEWLTMRES